MSGEPLRVTTEHLRDLAARHTQVAGDVTTTTELLSGLDARIRATHGVIAAPTAAAVGALAQARHACGTSIATGGRALSARLLASARRYDATDDSAGGRIDEPAGPR
ncbi:MAG: ESX-1 secretion-associated protein [Actinomycetota bacterium]|nr:ESX-1 secretion-associated protein [Actinomycetota bacterium]